jgi:hypothetical protein
MGKVYNVVLNSSQGTTVGDNRTVSFSYDWSRLPEKRYKLTFMFMTSLFTTTNVNVCNIYMDLGQANTFFAGNSTGTLPTGGYNYLGMTRYSGTGANNWLFADENFNVPHYLPNRPTANQFTVFLTNNDANRSAYTATSYPGNYTLTLCFEELDD